MNILKHKTLILVMIVTSTELLYAEEYTDRAANSISFLFILTIIGIVLILYSIVVSFILFSKKKLAKKSVNQFYQIDSIWNHQFMINSIEQTFFKVQQAWTERNQIIAEGFMTKKMFLVQKEKTDKLINSHKKNILDSIKLDEISIISARDFDDDSKDVFSAQLKGRMINYILNDNTNQVVDGDNKHYKPFNEIWRFKRVENKWLLDEIDDKVTIFILFENFE